MPRNFSTASSLKLWTCASTEVQSHSVKVLPGGLDDVAGRVKAVGMLYCGFVQNTAHPGATVDGQNIWYVPSPASSGFSPLDNNAKKLLDNI